MAKNRNNLHRLFGSLSQSIGRGQMREGALDVRESRERRDKIVPTFSPEKQKTQIRPKKKIHLRRTACCLLFARVEIVKIENSQKREICFCVCLCLRFFSKVGAHPLKM